MIRRITAVIAALVLSFAVTATANATQYPPTGDTTEASSEQGAVAQGEAYVFSGQLQPNSSAVATVRDANGNAAGQIEFTTDADGNYTVNASTATLAPGNYTVTIVGTDASGEPVVRTLAFTVTAAEAGGSDMVAGSGSALADTGADGVAVQVVTGAGLIVAGAALAMLTVVRRRNA